MPNKHKKKKKEQSLLLRTCKNHKKNLLAATRKFRKKCQSQVKHYRKVFKKQKVVTPRILGVSLIILLFGLFLFTGPEFTGLFIAEENGSSNMTNITLGEGVLLSSLAGNVTENTTLLENITNGTSALFNTTENITNISSAENITESVTVHAPVTNVSGTGENTTGSGKVSEGNATLSLTNETVLTENITLEEFRPVTLNKTKKAFRSDENISFAFEFDDQGKIQLNKKGKQQIVDAQEELKASLLDSSGRVSEIVPEIVKVGDKKFKVDVPKVRAFKPGKYALLLEHVVNGTSIIEEVDFLWGVLAINTHKSIYLPQETATIGIGVLDDRGHMVCDSTVTLNITDPANSTTTLSTRDGSITVSPECEVYGVTALPDYFTNYTTGDAGIYSITLTATSQNGIRNITDSFEVRNAVDFAVARNGPTRTYPPSMYTMNLSIHAYTNYNGPVIERIPSGFLVPEQEGLTITELGEEKILLWDMQLKVGETYSINYNFLTPQISPELFLLGPLEIGTFKEVRHWMIASDQPQSFNLTENFYGTSLAPSGDRVTNWTVMDFNETSFTAGYNASNDNVSTLTSGAQGSRTPNATSATTVALENGSMTLNFSWSSSDDFKRLAWRTNYTLAVSINSSVNQERYWNISYRAMVLGSAMSGFATANSTSFCVVLQGRFCAVDNRKLYLCIPVKGDPNATFNNTLQVSKGGYNQSNIKIVNTTGLLTSNNTWTLAVNQSIMSLVQHVNAWGTGCTDYNITQVQGVVRARVNGPGATITNKFVVDELQIFNNSAPGNSPTLATAQTNLTNSSASTADKFNSSIVITDLDSDVQNLTLVLFVNDAVNRSVQLTNNFASGATASYVWNDTNFTTGQTVLVQFNSTDGNSGSTSLNSTKVTIASSNTAPSLVNTTINVTNSTLTLTADTVRTTVNTSDSDSGDKQNITAVFYVNNAANITVQLNNNYADATEVIYNWNNTNITTTQVINVQFNGSDGLSATSFLNTSKITVNSSLPTIGNISDIAAQTVTEDGTKSLTFYFVASDPDGDLLNSSARANITNVNSTDISTDLLCSPAGTINTFTVNYTCTLDIWYYYLPGTWNITAQINDSVLANSIVQNTTKNFQIQDTTAIAVGPATVSFPSVTVGADNITSSNDPIVINNTGNHNSTATNIKVTGIDLRGETDASYLIPAANFTARDLTGSSPPLECGGNFLVNGTQTTITNATLPPGNRTAGLGVENLYVCLYDAPQSLTTQAYSATGSNSWVITVQ